MKKLKKILALTLVLISVMAIALPALAASSTIAPGGRKFKSYFGLSSAPTITVSLGSGTSTGMKCTVYLSLNDKYNPLPSGEPNWKLSNTVTLTMNSTDYTKTIRPGSSFGFNPDRSDAARIEIKAASTNSSSITVNYPE